MLYVVDDEDLVMILRVWLSEDVVNASYDLWMYVVELD